VITLTDTHIDILGMAPLDERSARCGDLNLTSHTTHKRQTSMLRRGPNPHSQ